MRGAYYVVCLFVSLFNVPIFAVPADAQGGGFDTLNTIILAAPGLVIEQENVGCFVGNDLLYFLIFFFADFGVVGFAAFFK